MVFQIKRLALPGTKAYYRLGARRQQSRERIPVGGRMGPVCPAHRKNNAETFAAAKMLLDLRGHNGGAFLTLLGRAGDTARVSKLRFVWDRFEFGSLRKRRGRDV